MQHENHAKATQNLQRYLRALSYFNDGIGRTPIDGVFDDTTERALQDFQRTEGLDPTGRADSETWETLYARYLEHLTRYDAPARISHFPRLPEGYAVELGEQQFLVQVIQHALRELAILYPFEGEIPLDGLYGEDTAAAVRVFQERHLLPTTGAVDRATWNALADAYNRAFGGYFAQ